MGAIRFEDYNRDDSLLFMGLNQFACFWIESYCDPVLVCEERTLRLYKDGQQETIGPYPVYDLPFQREESGEFYDGHPLYKYTFPDGQVYFERVQALLGKYVCLLALQNSKGEWVTESLWGGVDHNALNSAFGPS